MQKKSCPIQHCANEALKLPSLSHKSSGKLASSFRRSFHTLNFRPACFEACLDPTKVETSLEIEIFPKHFTVRIGCDIPWPCSKSLSAMCPPCVRFGRASKPCPACVREVSALCLLWPRLKTLSDVCPPCVRHVSAVCPPCVRLVSALAAPPNLVRHVSALYPPCARLLSALMSALCPLWPRLPTSRLQCCPLCPPCVRSLSFLCPLFVRSLFALYPLSAFVWVYGLALAEPLSALCPLFGLCAFVCSVSAFVRLEVFV